MNFDPVALEAISKRLRRDMWKTVSMDAVIECGIEERCFGPIQVTMFQALPEFPLLNTILGAAEPGAVADGHLAAAVEWADSFGVDYRVPVARCRPEMATAETWLNWHGFEQGQGVVKYVREATLPDLPGVPEVTVWEIGQDEADGETMVFAAGPALGLPSMATNLLFALPVQENWRTYTAELEEEIVSFGSMLIQGPVAAIGLDATIEEAQRRGCNQALLRERLLAAAAAGCETVVAEIPETDDEGVQAAVRNLLRAGFVPGYHSMNWQRPREWARLDRELWEMSL